MKTVVFYESSAHLAAKAPLHIVEHRARWKGSPTAASCS
jgi:hypothetical protein